MSRNPCFLGAGAVLLAAGTLAGCAKPSQSQQRVLSSGAIGAAGGVALTAIAVGPILPATAIGPGVGAVAGAVSH